jgi:DNA-binding response OmpR family regulator
MTDAPLSGKVILIVEDEASVREFLQAALGGAGGHVLSSDTVAAGLHLLRAHKPDLVVLDINLPDGSGLDVCREIRAHAQLRSTPVIMLTARAELEEKLEGLGAGADQYLTKPIDSRELVGWAEALLRRIGYDTGAGDQLAAGELRIDVKAQLVYFRDTVVSDLTGKEFDLLYFLVKQRPKVLSRKHILSNLWHTVAVDRLVDVHIGHLRRKLPPEAADRIQTVPGKGFRYFDVR